MLINIFKEIKEKILSLKKGAFKPSLKNL